MLNTLFEKLRKLAIKRKITVITATQPSRPEDISFSAGEPYFGRPTGSEPIFIDYINLL